MQFFHLGASAVLAEKPTDLGHFFDLVRQENCMQFPTTRRCALKAQVVNLSSLYFFSKNCLRSAQMRAQWEVFFEREAQNLKRKARRLSLRILLEPTRP